MKRAAAAAKINLALIVGPRRADGLHEVVTIYQRIALADRISVERSPELRVDGFAGDTLVRRALERAADGDRTSFAARIEKRIPVAAGLGGGATRCGRCSARCGARAISLHCRRTISPRLRSPTSSVLSGRSAPTSQAPGPPFTVCSCMVARRAKRRNESPPKGARGSRHQRGTVDF